MPEPWSVDAAAILASLGTDAAMGLSSTEAAERLKHHGPNQLRAAVRRHIASILLDQFRSIVVLLLGVACLLAVAFGDHVEGLAIFAVVIVNGSIGFVTEWRATRSMEALGRMGRVDTIVIRDGIPRSRPAEELVPGDIVVLEGGDVVTADLRLVEAAKLQADESSLTGESLPVRKDVDALPVGTPLMERRNMAFKGTALTRGSGRAVVVGTGLETELGRISELVVGAEAKATPLEQRLDRMAGHLVWVAAGLALVVAVAGAVSGRDLLLAIEVAIALAVAAIPEGLPIVATIALARGMFRMARRNALIARLSAVETLGATSVILTDKTGTLTENRMQVVSVWLADGERTLCPHGDVGTTSPVSDPDPRTIDLLRIGVLCSNATIDVSEQGDLHTTGDPTEVALLEAALAQRIVSKELRGEFPEIVEHAFDPDLKLMATLHRMPSGNVLCAVKGAPEAVIGRCAAERGSAGDKPLDDAARARWSAAAESLGGRGLRTLALATRESRGDEHGDDPYANLVLLGVVGLEDPPRRGIGEALARCRDAGITVVMATGDHAATARNVGREIGLVDGRAPEHAFASGEEIDRLLGQGDSARLRELRVLSRVSPEQKLRLIDFYQRDGAIVAMTGDGVNDAPALKKADIGVAMGMRGTAVAREAAAMILQDDEFGTIVEAVEQGRTIFGNIRKFVVYLLSCNISEVLVVSLATLAGAPLPLLPLQILFLNLVTDVFPALALGVGEGSDRQMKRRPRPASEAILMRGHWVRIVLHGLVISAVVLVAMTLSIVQMDFDVDRAVTVSFCTLALAQLWHVFNMRDDMMSPVANEITRNVWVWLALGLCLVLVLGSIYLPLPATLLGLSDPGPQGWLLILSMSAVPLLTGPFVRAVARRYASAQAQAGLAGS